MKPDQRLDQLRNKCPNLFKELTRIDCADGWFDLISRLCEVIEAEILVAAHQVSDDIRLYLYAVQIKEKFGGLRFYMNQSTPFIDGAIALAQAYSYTICEKCGKSGSPRTGGWVRTLCDKHHKQNQERIEKLNQKR